jgi:hypothetical protein
MEVKSYQVGQYRNGLFDCILSGMGKNRGTWDSTHSKTAAYRHAAQLRKEAWRARAGLSYRVLRTNLD